LGFSVNIKGSNGRLLSHFGPSFFNKIELHLKKLTNLYIFFLNLLEDIPGLSVEKQYSYCTQYLDGPAQNLLLGLHAVE